jgi:ribosome-binding protein aMBF1 (putative translation factor)
VSKSTFKDFNNLPVWLPKKLDESGLSPEQFANRVNVSRTMIYEYISDDARPSEQTASRMSRILGVKFEELLSQYTPKKNGRPRGGGITRTNSK